VNRRRLLARISRGSLKNIRLQDFVDLVEGFGFRLVRVRGSHNIFAHPNIVELINVQNAQGQAKPYQIRQFLRLVERYNLELEEAE
jgi:predicted RNA binding protein YcfA (HicA-like mRNA interferase family)